MKDKRKQWIGIAVLLILSAVTLYFMILSNDTFTFKGLLSYIKEADKGWVIMAVLCMIGFFVFEGLAYYILCKMFGYKRKVRSCIVYSAADVFFSAITPSASGGQPATAYFMIKDGIPGTITTIILLTNLELYVSALLVLGVLCFAACPTFFVQCNVISKVLIILGMMVQVILFFLFFMLIYKEKIVAGIARFGWNILEKINFINDVEEKEIHLAELQANYKNCAVMMLKHKKEIAQVFAVNILQRISIVGVTVCVYLSIGGSTSSLFDVFISQLYVTLGANGVPIPGSVGAVEYLFIELFDRFTTNSISLEIFSRGISFYCCLVICGIITFVASIMLRKKGK